MQGTHPKSGRWHPAVSYAKEMGGQSLEWPLQSWGGKELFAQRQV